jgi:hypothetical protein
LVKAEDAENLCTYGPIIAQLESGHRFLADGIGTGLEGRRGVAAFWKVSRPSGNLLESRHEMASGGPGRERRKIQAGGLLVRRYFRLAFSSV